MNEWLNGFTTVAGFCCWFLGFSALVLVCGLWVDKRWDATASWRRFWLMALALCWLPGVFWLLPLPTVSDPIIQLPPLTALDGDGWNEMVVGQSGARAETSLIAFLVCGVVVLAALVSGLRLARLLVGTWQVYQHYGESAPVQECVHPHIQTYCRRLERMAGIRVNFTQRQVSPFVFGLVRPRLVLSLAAIETLNFQALQLVVRHEWEHIKRRDHQWVFALHVLAAVAWFNPFYQRLTAKVMTAIEMDCDRAVLKSRPHKAPLYARTLLTLVARVSVEPTPAMAAFNSPSYKEIKMRLGRIVSKPKEVSCQQRWWVGVGSACLMLGTVALQPLMAVAEDMSAVIFQHPVPAARVSSTYGQKPERFHNGIDLAIAKGTPIVAAADGQVLVSTDVYGNRVNYGKLIIIEHSNGLRSLYSHLDSRAVESGEKVKGGQQIGTVGETGKVTGPHLHFEILSGDDRLDPSRNIAFSSAPAEQAALKEERMPRVY